MQQQLHSCFEEQAGMLVTNCALCCMQAENEENRRQLNFELGLLREEYSVLLYGGKMQLNPEVSAWLCAVLRALLFHY
jgi:hypothetical protein